MNPKRKHRLRQKAKMERKVNQLCLQMRHQPNDGTAFPVYWGIEQFETKLVPEEYGDDIQYLFDGDIETTFETLNQLFDWLKDNDLNTYPMSSDSVKEMIYEALDLDEAFNTLNIYDDRFRIVEIKTENVILKGPMFLLKDEAKEHIKQNSHNLEANAHTYALHAYRAPDTEALLTYLSQIKSHAVPKTTAKRKYSQ